MSKRNPMYLLAGGHWRNPGAIVPMFRRIFAENGLDHPRLAYVGTASGDAFAFFKLFEAFLKKAGASSVTRALLAKAKADVAQARKVLDEADVVFVSGGDVEEGIYWLDRHGLMEFFHELHDHGKLFMGLSAGSIMLGTQWVRWSDPDDDATAELFDCLGLAPLLCDMHAEEDGWDELQVAVDRLGPEGVGYGVPTGGILRVSPDGTLTALGKPAACFENHQGQVVEADDLPVR